MYNLRILVIYFPINKWLNSKYIKNLLESSDDILLKLGQTDESVNFTQQQIKQLHEAQKQEAFHQYKLQISLLKNPEATPNVITTIWNSTTSNCNTSSIFQAPDAIHFLADERILKFHVIEIGFIVDPDFSNVAEEFFMQSKQPHSAIQWEFISNVKHYLSDVILDQIKQFEE
ncbi:20540_t:CDS:2, partial [Cetraspora pellucida]